ncbi:CHAD domain-containing protein [Mycolicibacterium llatzerense]|uniref:CYTH and CHAD domain-containing protein n=1 Tax=Mycolicibacterium llatzerense TaxID=280871 RepID=UPI0008DE4D3B|nr:CHAD domain-containing protein [Mycolicibacterium llatzerense]
MTVLPPTAADGEYFDTPARDLAAHQISLLRRTDVSEPGWYLKFPAGPDKYAELHMSTSRGDDNKVPEGLRDLVLAIVRDRPLARVTGSPDEMSKPIRRKDDSVHTAISEQIEELLAWDRAMRSDAPDSVHQMRVAIRTIRSLLQSSSETFDLTEDGWVCDELSELAGALGMARDAEVLADRYQRALDGLPENLVRGPILRRLIDDAQGRYRSGRQASLTVMRSIRYFRLLDALEALVAADPPAQAPREKKLAKTAVWDGYKRVRRRVRAAAGAENHDVALHRIRKSAKRLRYTAAATGAAKVSEAAKAIQMLLGDHQDSVVSRANLAEQADAAHTAGEDTFTYGLLYHLETDLAAECESRLRAVLKTLDKAVHKEL